MKQPKGRGRNSKSRLERQRLRSSALAGAQAKLELPSRPKSVARSPFSSVQCGAAMSDKIAKHRSGGPNVILRARQARPALEMAHLAAALAGAKTKRRASSAAAHNATKLVRQRLVSAPGIISGAGAHIGLAAGRNHTSAMRSNPGMSLTGLISAQSLSAAAHPNKPVQPSESGNEMDLIKSTSKTLSWHWNEEDCSHEVRSLSK